MLQETLLLVDGTGVAYRAFYAIARLSTKAGQPTNAVFGFIKMLLQMDAQWKPAACVVVFDGGLPAERMARLPTYKAQRKEIPDDLRSQFAMMEEFLACAGILSLRVEGEEADDVIATLADRGVREGRRVLIASSDKDLFQLVTDGVEMIGPQKAAEKMDAAAVHAKTGVWPQQIVDWLALTGDSSDNIPGVPGVGPKTAAKLLADYGSVDGLWQRLSEVESDRIRDLLVAHRDAVERNLELVRLRKDIPLQVTWSDLQRKQVPAARLISFYESMEFASLAKGLRESEELRRNPELF
ncbi:MAG TPA: 5'-3' exonuclease H3TH domain-containing protein [Kiritimatiellia bacterium]|nr:5'-3' exonuclease H3TH domain-containing protein [Kiritimatiellia bacterium]